MDGSITTGSCVIILIIGSLFYHDIGLFKSFGLHYSGIFNSDFDENYHDTKIDR